MVRLRLVALTVLVACITHLRAADPPKEAAPMKVEVVGEELTIAGTKVSFPVERKTLFRLLGEPSRTSKKANTIYTWDESGVFAYETPGKDEITQIDLAVRDMSTAGFAFWPKKTFAGQLTFDGAEYKADSTPETLNKAKKGNPFTRDKVFESQWALDGKALRVSVNLASKDGADYKKDGQIAEVIFQGPKGK